MVPDPIPDPTSFFSDFKDAKKNFYFIFFAYNLPTNTLSSGSQKFNFLQNFCVKILIASIIIREAQKHPDPVPDTLAELVCNQQ